MLPFWAALATKKGADEITRRIEGFPVQGGITGQKVSQIDATANAIMKVSMFAAENSEIR